MLQKYINCIIYLRDTDFVVARRNACTRSSMLMPNVSAIYKGKVAADNTESLLNSL